MCVKLNFWYKLSIYLHNALKFSLFGGITVLFGTNTSGIWDTYNFIRANAVVLQINYAWFLTNKKNQ